MLPRPEPGPSEPLDALNRAQTNPPDALNQSHAIMWGLAGPRTRGRCEPADDSDPLTTAINQPCGRGLEAVLTLSLWHLRQRGSLPADLPAQLNACLVADDPRAMHHRAVLTRWRPILEDHISDWYGAHRDELFRDAEYGRATLDLTLQWSRPTSSFDTTFRAELSTAAKQGSSDAVTWSLIACLNDEAGYEAPGSCARSSATTRHSQR